ncbi:uncharacterized protein LOC128156128 [Crassostrea angulata]|uniref:uncharacterized protein LOC128156128 n=1 Tax=Magallana angulata TaxID=2784310 RepID=UPI0022B16D98|nr:uncharacterized protein LOC128156128 [Crassostrea angulata]
MKVAQLLCLLWILYLNTDVLAQRQRGVRKENTRNDEPGYGRRQASPSIGKPAESRERNRNDGRNRGHRQRGARKGNTRNSDIRYGRRQASPSRGKQAKGRERNRNYGRNGGRRRASPEPVLTERKMMQTLCKHCNNRDPNSANCRSVCQESNSPDGSRAFSRQLGDSFCYFCENYRSNWSYYQLCRNRLCAAGK